MNTSIINLKDFLYFNDSKIIDILSPAINELINGDVVAFPTETVYGLGANALNKEAIEKIYKIKGRPSDNPLIVHIASVDQIDNLIDLNNSEIDKNLLINRINKAIKFWPGPISFILPSNKKVIPEMTRGGLETVALRFPDHKIAQILIEKSSFPIAAPSANISGKPSCTNAEDVFSDFNGKINFIVDGGDSVYGIESTVLDLSSEIPTILRPGFITLEDLSIEFEDIILNKSKLENRSIKSPGMKYKHYKPDAKVIILLSMDEFINTENHILQSSEPKKLNSINIKEINNIPETLFQQNKFLFISEVNLQLLNFEKIENRINEKIIFNNSYEFAKNIYSNFRYADKKKYEYVIIRPAWKFTGIGNAILNRILKATDEIWII